MIQRLACLLVFLILTSEFAGATYEGHWSTPMNLVGDNLVAPMPIIRLWWLDGIALELTAPPKPAPLPKGTVKAPGEKVPG